MDLVSSIYCNQNSSYFGCSPEGDEPLGYIGGPNGYVIARLHSKSYKGSCSSIYVPSELPVCPGVIQGGILEGILVRIEGDHGIQYVAKCSVYSLVLLPREGSCLTSIFIEGESAGVVSPLSIHKGDEVGQDNIRVSDFFVPLHTDKAFIVQRLQCSQELGHRKLSFPDKNASFSVAIPKPDKADICTQCLYRCFCAFRGGEEGLPCIPRRSQGSGGEGGEIWKEGAGLR